MQVTAPTTDRVADPAAGTEPAAEAPAAARRRPARAVLLGVLRGYQALRSGHPSPCRFYPSCSAYAVEAVTEHGAWRGTLLAARRVARCRPGGGRGVDLVPPVAAGRGGARR